MSDEPTEPKSPFAKRGFVFAAIGVGAIALAAVVALLEVEGADFEHFADQSGVAGEEGVE